ncbi:DNA ligase D [Anatilimnocola aggregata]|nr:DNA ligase D [Anatilimnocola aggregata]
MSLAEYQRKRHFRKTAEPKGTGRRKKQAGNAKLTFVVQKHAASRLHYDVRLELGGVLKSWAVPKGPSLNPSQKRLAVAVEDHPLEYAKFEGTIPAGEYGAGEVIVWDRGIWTPVNDPRESLQKGNLEFELHGEKLSGNWRLIQLRGREGGKNWLLIKRHDAAANKDGTELTDSSPESVITGRSLATIVQGNPAQYRQTRRTTEKERRGAPKVAARAKTRAPTKRNSKGTTFSGKQKRVAPQLAKLATIVPTGDEWLHEIKYDGYRLICTLSNGEAKLWTRNRLDWTHRFSGISAAIVELSASSAILDGEIVALSENGVSNFQALQNALQGSESQPLVYYVFDLLELNGEDLRPLPLIERKRRLKALLPKSGAGRLRFSDHLSGDGSTFLAHSCRLGLEGIISKRGDRPYSSGRSNDWLKIKCLKQEELVIGGFTASAADNRRFGTLLLGYFHGRKFKYAGRVGTGFDSRLLTSLRAELDERIVQECPFDPIPTRERGPEVRWVLPQLVAQIQFTGWTEEAVLRHPVFLGRREDKTARSVGPPESLAPDRESNPLPTRKQAIKSSPSKSKSAIDFPFTNPARILYPDLGLTKLDLASYCQQVADWMLPYLENRPLSLLRCPEGQAKSCFFQKHAAAGTPAALRRIEIDEKHERVTYLVADDLPGLLSLAQMGVLEIHVWGSRADRLEYPDWLVFDLDPAPDVPWSKVVETAFLIRDLLSALDLQTFPKLTGGKGLHVVAPLSPRRADWKKAKEFSQTIAQLLAQEYPDCYVAKMSKAARRGKIFIDYLRNDRGSTAIAPYSTRAKSQAPVSMPISWKELSPRLASDFWTVQNARQRLESLKRNPWQEFFQLKQKLPKIDRNLRRIISNAIADS